MSFIPGEQSDIAAVASLNGSGIIVTTSGDIDYVATNLVAGAGIAITPSLINKSISISSTGGGGGISAVSTGVGSGMTATTVGTAVTLTSALVSGSGISIIPAGAGTNLTISNTNTLSSATGSGIALTTVGTNTAVAANLVAGAGIAITPSGLNSSKSITNSGVTQLNAGTGITLTANTGAITVSSTGGNVISQTILPAGTGLWNLSPSNFKSLFANSFGIPPNTLDTFGRIYTPTASQGVSGICPPTSFNINFRCPVATVTTMFSPQVLEFPAFSPIKIRCELLNYNVGTGTVISWLDTQTVIAFINNTGAFGTPPNVPYLSFNATLTSSVNTQVSPFANGAQIFMNFTMSYTTTVGGDIINDLAFNPSGVDAGVGNLPYSNCAGLSIVATTLS